jgi:hypothetical protein
MLRVAKILLIVLLFTLGNCSMQNKLNRTYNGKNESYLISKMGQPTNVEKLTNGNKVDVYEKHTILREVPINTGRIQYDSFNSPKTSKIELFRFKINQSGLIEESGYDFHYER